MPDKPQQLHRRTSLFDRLVLFCVAVWLVVLVWSQQLATRRAAVFGWIPYSLFVWHIVFVVGMVLGYLLMYKVGNGRGL